MPILDPVATRQKMIDIGLLLESESITKITAVLQDIEIMLIEWLGWNPAVTEYTEILHPGSYGSVVTGNYPITEVVSIEHYHPSGVSLCSVEKAWDGSLRTLHLDRFDGQFLVTYKAGLEPIPPIFQVVLTSALKSLCTDGRLSTEVELLSQRQDVKTISLPGGLKQEFFDRGGTDSESTSGLDRIFKLLQPYRRTVITGGSIHG